VVSVVRLLKRFMVIYTWMAIPEIGRLR